MKIRQELHGYVNLEEVSKVIMKAINIGMLQGLVYDLLLGFLAYFQFINYPFLLISGIVVALSIFTSMNIVCVAASIFPIVLEKLDFDPAISAGHFITTFIDIIGVLSDFLIVTTLLPFK